MRHRRHREKPRSGRSRRSLPYVISLLVLLAVLTAFQTSRPAPSFPPLSIHFTERISQGLHVYPFGEFVLTNVSGQALEWSYGDLEAPSDPTLSFSALANSNAKYGKLEPNISTNFYAIVPNTKGVSFRIVIHYYYKPRAIDRLRANLLGPFPMLDRVWPAANHAHTFTSQWFRASADYGPSLNVSLPR